MLNLRLPLAVGPALILLGLAFLVPSTDVMGQNKNIDHVVIVFPQDEVCITTPDTLRVKPNQTIAFFAKDGGITVSSLKSKPHNIENGKELSDAKDRKAKQGKFSQKIKIKDDAKGLYTYVVTCDGVGDDPPTIIVD